MIFTSSMVMPMIIISAESACETRMSISNTLKGRYRLSMRRPSTIMRSKPYHAI